MKTFKKRPIQFQFEYKALQFSGTEENFNEIKDWLGDHFDYNYQKPPNVFLQIKKKEKWNVARMEDLILNVGNWIVCRRDDYFEAFTDKDFNRIYFEDIEDETI